MRAAPRRARACRGASASAACRAPCSSVVSVPALDQQLLDLRDRLAGIQDLRAILRAVQDRMAAIEPERILERVEPLARRLVAAVDDPAIGLQQHGRTEIALGLPPVARA